MALFAFLGLAVTSATVVMYGAPVVDPVQLLGKMQGLVPICLSLFGEDTCHSCHSFLEVYTSRACTRRALHDSLEPNCMLALQLALQTVTLFICSRPECLKASLAPCDLTDWVQV
jgi:hypothetical protein